MHSDLWRTAVTVVLLTTTVPRVLLDAVMSEPRFQDRQICYERIRMNYLLCCYSGVIAKDVSLLLIVEGTKALHF